MEVDVHEYNDESTYHGHILQQVVTHLVVCSSRSTECTSTALAGRLSNFITIGIIEDKESTGVLTHLVHFFLASVSSPPQLHFLELHRVSRTEDRRLCPCFGSMQSHP